MNISKWCEEFRERCVVGHDAIAQLDILAAVCSLDREPLQNWIDLCNEDGESNGVNLLYVHLKGRKVDDEHIKGGGLAVIAEHVSSPGVAVMLATFIATDLKEGGELDVGYCINKLPKIPNEKGFEELWLMQKEGGANLLDRGDFFRGEYDTNED